MTRTSGLKLSWLRRALPTLRGTDTQILARAPVDTAEMTGRGIAALIPAAFGGLAAVISFLNVYRPPLGAAAAAGANWAEELDDLIVGQLDIRRAASAPSATPISSSSSPRITSPLPRCASFICSTFPHACWYLAASLRPVFSAATSVTFLRLAALQPGAAPPRR